MASSGTSTEIAKLKQTKAILYRIQEKCAVAEERDPLENTQHYLTKAADLTGFSIQALDSLEHKDVPDIKSLVSQKVVRGDILKELTEFYLERRTIPSTRKLFYALNIHDKLPHYVDIRLFRKMLVEMGFVWKHVPNTTKFVILENPSITFERFNYLNSIIRCRNGGKPIVYVGEIAVNDNPGEFYVFAVGRGRVICLEYINETFPLLQWFQSDLILNVPRGAVVVLRTNKINSREIVKKPNVDSHRHEMEEWLDHHKVPFHPDLPKTQLYDLVRKFTNHVDKVYEIDSLLETHGYEVYRLPKHLNELTPAVFVSRYLNEHYTLPPSAVDDDEEDQTIPNKNHLFEFLKTITPIELGEFEKGIEESEQMLLDNDIKIDLVIDDLFDNVSEKLLEDQDDSDVPSADESDQLA